MVSEVAQTISLVTSDSSSCVSEMLLPPEVEEGKIVVWDAVKDLVSREVFNPFISLDPLVNGVHLLDSVPLLLKPLHPVENLLLEMDNSSVLGIFGDLQQE